MNKQNSRKTAPNLSSVDLADKNNQIYKKYCSIFRRRQDALTLIRQLNQLSRAVQRHRGMSMAILAGSDLFQGDFAILQKQLERRLALLEEFTGHAAGLLDPKAHENLYNAWHTIRSDFHDDDVIDNFELHSHFIEQLQAMIYQLARSLEKPVSVLVAQELDIELPEDKSQEYPRLFQQIEVIAFAASQVPEMVEHVARIRGLATYAAAKKECDFHHDRKLRYAISCARTANEKLRHHAERLESVLPGAIESLALVKTYELKLMFLINMVESDILSGLTISTNSHNLFKLATEIIDVYIKVVDDAFNLIGAWADEDIESWLCQ